MLIFVYNLIQATYLNEITINLNEINLSEFYGENNSNLKLIKTSFPKLKIVDRDTQLTAMGNEEILTVFLERIEKIIAFQKFHNRLTTIDIENLILDHENHEVKKDDTILYGIGGKPIKAVTTNQKKIVTAIEENDLVFVSGPAGTGKTYTCVALAVRALKNKQVKRIILTRPAVEAGERIGFLPGDAKEKLDPYMQPLYDSLRDMIPKERLESFFEKGIIEIAPLAFMRGRTLDHAFVILDEAQNSTQHQMKMFLTRMGKSAKFMITGDPGQKDLDENKLSGIDHALKILTDIKGISSIKLNASDVMRHRLVRDIISAYER